jgi:hypothetical protein
MCSAAARSIALPVSVEPVNVILGMPGCAAMAAPVTGPSPCTTLNTPGGMPASSVSSARTEVLSGACSAIFSTTELPTTRAGAVFQQASTNG